MRGVSTGCNNAAAQNFRHDLSRFSGAIHAVIRELIRRETLGVKRAETGFDAVIKINKAPGELPRQERADSGLARTHETGQTQNGGTRLRPAQRRCSCHAIVARKTGAVPTKGNKVLKLSRPSIR